MGGPDLVDALYSPAKAAQYQVPNLLTSLKPFGDEDPRIDLRKRYNKSIPVLLSKACPNPYP